MASLPSSVDDADAAAFAAAVAAANALAESNVRSPPVSVYAPSEPEMSIDEPEPEADHDETWPEVNAPSEVGSEEGELQNALEAMTVVDIGPALDRLADEILLLIMELLRNPKHFSRTCRRFNQLSKDLLFRARWLTTRYRPYEVLFEAIARPRIFSCDLFELLMGPSFRDKGKAILSRNLAQLLHVLGRTIVGIPGQRYIKWASSIELSVYYLVLHEARCIYGESSRDFELLDRLVFQEWRDGRGDIKKVKRLFARYRFMPLPLALLPNDGDPNEGDEGGPLMVEQESTRDVISALLASSPDFVALAWKNGYELDLEDSLSISRHVFRTSYTTQATCQQIFTQLEQLYQYGFAVPRLAAMNVIASMQWPEEARPPYVNAYVALFNLHADGRLDFDLQQVIEEVLAGWNLDGVDESMRYFVNQVELEFPAIDVDSLFVQLEFLKIEAESHVDLDGIKASIGARKVTYSDLMEVSLRNLCCSTAALEYGVAYVAGFDLSAFLAELLDSMLYQSYRGKMVLKLDKFCSSYDVDFRQLLSDAIEAHAFTACDLPAQRCVVWEYQWQEDISMRVQEGTVKSMLAITNSLAGRHRDPPRTLFLPGFTRFVTGSEDTTEAPVNSAQDQHVRLEGIDEALESISDDYAVASETMRLQMHKRSLKNWCGVIPKSWCSISRAIVEILGPESKAANVCFSHSVLNGKNGLSLRLLNMDVPLTLEHICIGLTVGRALPQCLGEHILAGAAFKASFESSSGKPDHRLLSQRKRRAGAALSDAEQIMCQERWNALKEATPGLNSNAHVYVEINVREGLIDLSCSTVEPARIVTKIFTRPAPRSSPSTSTTATACEAKEDGTTVNELCTTAKTVNDHDDSLVSQPQDQPRRSSRVATRAQQAAHVSEMDSGDESSGSIAEEGIACYAVQLDDAIPVVWSAEELRRRHDNLELWQSHLLTLRYLEERKYAAIDALARCAEADNTWNGRLRISPSSAHAILLDIISKIRLMIKSLRNAVPIESTEGALLQELKDLWAEVEESDGEDGEDAKAIKRRVQELLGPKKDLKQRAYRRSAFRNSESSRNVPNESKTGEPAPLEDEDSADDDFVASLESSEAVADAS